MMQQLYVMSEFLIHLGIHVIALIYALHSHSSLGWV